MGMNPLIIRIIYTIVHQQSSLILYVPIQRLDVEVVPLVGARKEANAGGVGEGVDTTFDDLQLLRSWRGKRKEENHTLKKKEPDRDIVLYFPYCQQIP